MKVWAWFAAPPLTLLAAYYAMAPLEKALPALKAPPTVASLSLPAPAPSTPAQVPGGGPKAIALSAFGIAVADEVNARGAALRFAPPAKELFVLESVLITDDRSSATIDGQVYQVGDKLARRYLVQAIDQNTVWVRGPRGREALHFPEFKDSPATVAAAMAGMRAAPATAPGGTSPANPMQAPPAVPGALPSAGDGKPVIPPLNAGQLGSEYRKILEMLKL